MPRKALYFFVVMIFSVVSVFVAVCLPGCTREPGWQEVNERVIKENNVGTRNRDDIPETGVVSNLVPGKVTNIKDLPDVELAPGVTCKMYWSRGNLVNWMTMEPGSEIPRETLSSERIMVVWKGSVEQLVNGEFVTMRQSITTTNWTSTPRKDFVYLPRGAENGMRSGDEGAEILEIYWPVRLDYVEKAGGKIPAKQTVGQYHLAPSVPPNKVLNLYDVQFTMLLPSVSERNVNSRLIWGEGMQCSFLSVDPLRISPFHTHPEEQIMIILRGYMDEYIMDGKFRMEEGDIVYLPRDMVHRGEHYPRGCDILDVFWPVRPDYVEKMNDRLSRYHAIIPEDAQPVLVHDGSVDEPTLNFTEGPSWMDGRLYFSNMWFESDWSAGSPEKSNLIRMDRDGSFKVILKNMQTNGTMPLGNGNLAVCDMYGHRIIEVTPEGGIVRTLVDEYNGERIDGPNDLVIDAKGGIYFTDPQFIPGLEKKQPGKSVYYRKPDGELIRVVEPGRFGQPNGILLSPDGGTCYINNTRNMPVGNYVAAFDVNEDGTLSNMRNFAKLFIPPEVLNNEEVTTGADGMTIDVQGNIYVATQMGLQIFDNRGEFIGIVHFPVRPVSAVFGGDDMQTIYCTCATRIYSIRTNVKGLQFPLKL